MSETAIANFSESLRPVGVLTVVVGVGLRG
jgi:hypothetical protein